MNRMICKECAGTKDDHPESAAYRNSDYGAPCPRCKGTGIDPEPYVDHRCTGVIGIGPLPIIDGVGSRLHRIVAEKGFEIGKDCECPIIIARMNREGPEWCRANTSYIVAAMVREAHRRGIVIPGGILGIKARQWVNEAIAEWEATHTPSGLIAPG